MNNIKVFSCAGDTVIIAEGVADGEEEKTAAEIIKKDVLGVQTAFLKSTQIVIPKMVAAGALFSADAALCCAEILCQKEGTAARSKLSCDALGAPLRIRFDAQSSTAFILLAAKARLTHGAPLPSVIFGGCEYFICTALEQPDDRQILLAQCCEASAQNCVALLEKVQQNITPSFVQKQGETCSFSAGSAAIALAFFESDASRDFFETEYCFPKGSRHIRMKRFLSEAFDCTLSATINATG